MRHSVCLREGSSEGKEGATAGKCCIYCEKRRNKTESSRKFEHMIKDALDIYRRRYKGERRYWERKSESVRKGKRRTPAAS